MKATTNTDRVINELAAAEQAGVPYLRFRVGRYTGVGPSVVAALKRRGFIVNRVPHGAYEVRRADA